MRKDWGDKKFVHYWKNYVGTARPSPSDLKFIKKKILEKGKNVKVLILGATVEYRDLCGKLGIEVTLIDYSRYNYEYLKKEIKHKPKEKFIEGDWLTTVLNKKFDIILADNVINVLRKKNLEKLCLNVCKMLKNDGLFMARTYVRNKDERYTGEEVIKEYRKKEKKDFYTWTIRNFFISAYNFKEDCITLKDAWNILMDLYNKKLINKGELDVYKNLSMKNREFKFFIPLIGWLDKTFLKFFKIKEIFYGKEKYLKDQLPLHVLTRK